MHEKDKKKYQENNLFIFSVFDEIKKSGSTATPTKQNSKNLCLFIHIVNSQIMITCLVFKKFQPKHTNFIDCTASFLHADRDTAPL